METLDNSSLSGAIYSWSLANAAATPTLSNVPSLTAGSRGVYSLTLSAPGQSSVCEAYITLSATPCQTLTAVAGACSTITVNSPTEQTPLPVLYVGDQFNAGDYVVQVTEVAGGSGPAGYNGKGTIQMRLLAGISVPVSVVFTNARINECQALFSGTVVTQYDPEWSNIVDIGGIIGLVNRLEELYGDLKDLLENYKGTATEKQKLLDYQSQLTTLQTQVTTSTNFQPDTKQFYLANIGNTQATLQCLADKPVVTGAPTSPVPNARQAATCDAEGAKTALEQQQKDLANVGWVQLATDDKPETATFKQCIGLVDYRELMGVPASGDPSKQLKLVDAAGKEIATINATVKGKFYSFHRDGVDYYYAKAVPATCDGKRLVLVRQYFQGDTSLGGIFSYYDDDLNKYIPFTPLNYPTITMGAMIKRMGPGLSTFADVTEAVFVNTLTFIGGGGAVGSTLRIGKVLQGLQWTAFALEQVKAVYPNWDASTKQWFGKANWALLAIQVAISIAEVRQLKNLAAAERAASERIAVLNKAGEFDGIISQARQYSKTLPANHPFRTYIERLAGRLTNQLLGKYGTRLDDLVEVLPKESLFGDGPTTFLDMVYRTVKTKQPITIFRSFGGVKGKLTGTFATMKRGATREELAMLTEWKNSMRFEAKLNVPTDTKLNLGRVGPQKGKLNPAEELPGLGEQVVLHWGWDLRWVDEIVDTQTGTVYRSVDEFKRIYPELFLW